MTRTPSEKLFQPFPRPATSDDGCARWLALAWQSSRPPRPPETQLSPDRWFRKLRSPEFCFTAAKGYPQGPGRGRAIFTPRASMVCLVCAGHRAGRWNSEGNKHSPLPRAGRKAGAPDAHRKSNYKYDKLSKRRA